MKKIRGWILRFGGLFNKQRKDDELDDEIESHLQLHIEDNLRLGLTPEEARHQAMIKLGGIESTKEAYRDQRGLPWMETFWQDVRYGARMLRKNPGFTVVASLTLALGIGANTAIFSVVNRVLLRPLPYDQPDRLVLLTEKNLERGYQQVLASAANIFDWRAQNSVFEGIAGECYESYNLTGSDKPEHLNAAVVTANYFTVLGVRPFLGRNFLDGEDLLNEKPVVLSYRLWERSFGGKTSVLDMKISLNGRVHTVVGVMPRGFTSFNPTTVVGRPTGDVQPQLWVAYPITPAELVDRNAKFFLGLARLKPGVTLAQAASEMKLISARLEKDFPVQKGWSVDLRLLSTQVAGAFRSGLLTLMSAVGFILLITCANVANLLLSRSAARETEFVIRVALGAGRGRIIRQLLAENLLLALLGGASGLLLAYCSLGALLAFAPPGLPQIDQIHLDNRVLGFTFLLTLLTGIVCGLAPAVQVALRESSSSLISNRRGTAGTLREGRSRRFFVVAEMALALILLVGAGLMIKSYSRLVQVSPGFRSEQLLACDITLPDPSYAQKSKRLAVVKEIHERLRALPGIDSAATICGLPFGTMLNVQTRARSERSSQSASSAVIPGMIGWRLVSADYFSIMEIPVLKGRPFTGLDSTNSLPVAIINETLARREFPQEDPIGKRILVYSTSESLVRITNACEIIGVVRDVKVTGLDAPAQPELYQPHSQDCLWLLSLVVRSSLPPASASKMLRDAVLSVDSALPIYNLRTLDHAIANSFALRRYVMILLGLFATVSLVLAAIGIYSTVSYAVTRQTKEIGIRMALGAGRDAVLKYVLRGGFVLAVIGLAGGLVGSLALTRLIRNQLFEVGSTDPITFLCASGLLLLTALLAAWIPALRATKVDPIVALRFE